MNRANKIRALLAAVGLGTLAAASAAAQTVDTGLKKTAETAFGGAAKLQTDPAVIIGNLIKALLGFVSVIFLLLMIYGGFLWMTARGNEQQIEKAKNLITAAVIGVVIIAAGYAITTFVVGALVGASQQVI